MTDSLALPSTRRKWERRVALRKLQNLTVHTIKLSSASAIEEIQYLSLRVLWKANHSSKLNLSRFDLVRWISRADDFLGGYSSWHIYRGSFNNRLDDIPESTLVPAQYFQRMVEETSSTEFAPSVAFSPIAGRTRGKTGIFTKKMADMHLQTPSKTRGTLPSSSDEDYDDSPEPSESPFVSDESPKPEDILDKMRKPTKDEEIVTAALSNFLVGLTVHSRVPNRWTVHRKAFNAVFEHASFEARVDGYLEDRRPSGKVRALVEVKPVMRRKKAHRIRMQEGAEMVAWIKNSPDPKGSLNRTGRRVLVSQDRHQIFITFAEYQHDYIRYLANDPGLGPDLPFLTMQEFGPWDISSRSQVQEVSRILLAISLRAQSDLMREEGQGGGNEDDSNNKESEKNKSKEEEDDEDSEDSEDESSSEESNEGESEEEGNDKDSEDSEDD